jgi:hypothetical protein
MEEEKKENMYMEIPNGPQIYVRSEDNKEQSIGQLGFVVGEENIGIIQSKQDDKEGIRRQKTHQVLNDQELETIIGVNKRANPLDALNMRAENIEVSCMGNLKVSLYWEEKFLSLIKSLQLMGFYYVIFYEQIPQSSYSIFNAFPGFIMKFDYIYFYQNSLSNYNFLFIYVIAWAGACGGIFLLILYFVSTGKFQKYSISSPHWIFKSIYYSLEILAFPFLMNTVPYAFGQLHSSIVGLTVIDPWASNFQFVLAICAAIVVVVILVIAIVVWSITNSNYVYDTNDHHEAYIKMKELEYVFDLSFVWKSNWFFLFSSFKREGFALFHRSIFFVYIIFLTVGYSLCQQNVDTLFYVVVLIAVVFNLFITMKPPFRSGSSNITYIVLSNVIIYLIRY